MSNSRMGTGAHSKSSKRKEQIEDILLRVRLAKSDAQELDLKFEAYLLDMATMALSERLQSCRPGEQ